MHLVTQQLDDKKLYATFTRTYDNEVLECWTAERDQAHRFTTYAFQQEVRIRKQPNMHLNGWAIGGEQA